MGVSRADLGISYGNASAIRELNVDRVGKHPPAYAYLVTMSTREIPSLRVASAPHLRVRRPKAPRISETMGEGSPT